MVALHFLWCVAVTFFGNMLILPRHFIIAFPSPQGDTEVGPICKTMPFPCTKSTDSTVTKIDGLVVPSEGERITKLNKERVLGNKALVINVGARGSGR